MRGRAKWGGGAGGGSVARLCARGLGRAGEGVGEATHLLLYIWSKTERGGGEPPLVADIAASVWASPRGKKNLCETDECTCVAG